MQSKQLQKPHYFIIMVLHGGLVIVSFHEKKKEIKLDIISGEIYKWAFLTT